MAKIEKQEGIVESGSSKEAYVQFKKLIEAYQKQNPVKYERKKAALLAKLESLK